MRGVRAVAADHGTLTDEQWATLEPLLPRGAKAGRPPVWPRRQLVDGIRFRVWTGVPWRDVPVEYGPWNRVYDLFRRWRRNGSRHRILTRLQSLADAKGCLQLDRSDVSATPPPHTHSSQPRALPKHAPVGHWKRQLATPLLSRSQ
ncbi:transposase [Streptomyces sp. NPDC012756]|uniref:transposase n=1 Tax=Streptomyces sp. NPDC012756 TaxID=3364847 RepID=UPI0036A84EEE